MAESIIRLKVFLLAARENDACARHPVGFFSVNQVADNIEWTERVGAFVVTRKLVGKIVEKLA
jgi:hypothetical protein